MQDHPGAPGTARQGSTRTIVSTNRGGKATQPRAPGHERPLTAQRAARHGRLSADSGAPGADVPLATTAGAPGQHCLSAALRAPGHGRFPTAQRAAGHDRLSAAPIATAPLPARVRRLLSVILPRVPATPNTLTYSHSRRTAEENRAQYSHAPTYRQPRSTTHQVHPATQVPPRPRSCSTACTGFPLRHHSRAPPAAATPLPCQGGSQRIGPPPVIPACPYSVLSVCSVAKEPSERARCEAPTIPSAFYW